MRPSIAPRRCAGAGAESAARAVEGRGGDDLGQAVAVEVGDLQRRAEMELDRARRWQDPRDVAGERGVPEVREIDEASGGQGSAAADEVDGAAIGRETVVLLIRAHREVRDPVARHVAGPQPHAETIARGDPDERRDGHADRRCGEVDGLERRGLVREGVAADEDRDGACADAPGARRVVLAGDQDVGDAVTRDVVHPDLAAGVLEGSGAQDAQDARVRDAGIDRARDRAVAEEHEDLARVPPAEGARAHGREGDVVVAVTVDVVSARDRDAEASVAARAVQPEQSRRPARNLREVEAAGRRAIGGAAGVPALPAPRAADGEDEHSGPDERLEGAAPRIFPARRSRALCPCRSERRGLHGREHRQADRRRLCPAPLAAAPEPLPHALQAVADASEPLDDPAPERNARLPIEGKGAEGQIDRRLLRRRERQRARGEDGLDLLDVLRADDRRRDPRARDQPGQGHGADGRARVARDRLESRLDGRLHPPSIARLKERLAPASIENRRPARIRAAGEQAPRERRVGEESDPLRPHARQDLGLDAAVEQVVEVLRAREPPVAEQAIGDDDVPRREVRDADGPDLALVAQALELAEGLVQRRMGIPLMDLHEVEAFASKAREALLDVATNRDRPRIPAHHAPHACDFRPEEHVAVRPIPAQSSVTRARRPRSQAPRSCSPSPKP
jgi:hypothetical protein